MKKINALLKLSASALLLTQFAYGNTPAAASKTDVAQDKKADVGAKPLSLAISGKLTAIGGGVSQDDESNGKEGDISFMIPKSDIDFKISGRSSGGTEYGYLVRVKAISDSVGISRSYVEFKGDFGVVQLGNVTGPDDTMGTYGAYEIMGGSGGGVNGYANNFYNMSEGVINGTTIIGSPGSATKITYYTPDLEGPLQGFKVGVSYTPDTSHRGKQSRDNSRVTTKGDDGNESCIFPNETRYGWGLNNFTIGLSYDREWNDSKLNLNFVTIRENGRFVFLESVNAAGLGVIGSRTPYNLQDTLSYMFSCKYTYQNWDISASFLNNINSRLPTKELEEKAEKDDEFNKQAYMPIFMELDANGKSTGKSKEKSYTYQGNAGKAFNIGSSYTFGAYKAALGYFRTDRKATQKDKTSMNAVSATLDFKALEGLTFFGEVTYLQTKTTKDVIEGSKAYLDNKNGGTDSAIGNNQGTVFMLGTKIAF